MKKKIVSLSKNEDFKSILGGKKISNKYLTIFFKKLSDKNNWFYAQQFENKANADIHEKTTGEEIFNDFKNIGLDYWVSGYGTGGTFTGVSRVLREKMPQTKLILTEPDV